MKQLFTFFIIGWFVLTNLKAQTGTVADPYIVNSFPHTETNLNSTNGESAIGMNGSCHTIGCCSILVFKVILPADGSLWVEMTNFTPLAGSLIAYTPDIPNPTGFSDLTYVSGEPGNFCGFRDTLQLGWGYKWYSGTWNNLNDFIPAGTYYVLFFNHNNQSGGGAGNSDVTFQFVPACDELIPQPIIEVEGNGVTIVSGDDTPSVVDDTDYGNTISGASAINKTYTIKNVSANSLDVNSVTISGTQAANFSVSTAPTSPVGGNSNTTFTVQFTPGTVGLNTATISVNNSDCDNTPYSFDVQAFVLALNPSDKRGEMLDLSGSSEYVVIDNVATPMDGVTAFTFEAWFNADADQVGNDRIISVNTSSGGNVVLLYLDDGIIETYDGSSDVFGTTDLRGTGWHHIAFTHDNADHRVYLDGVLLGTKAGSVSTFSSTNLWSIGQEYDSGPSPGDYWLGQMDEVRIWNDVRTEQEIRENMHRTFEIADIAAMPNLKAYYQFDNDDAAETADGVKDILGNHGTTVGGTYANSEISVGGGKSATQTVNASGTYTFTDTDIELTFTTSGGESLPNADIVVTKISTEQPINVSANEMTNNPATYWVINNFGTNSNLNVDIKIGFQEGQIDDNIPANHSVHKRGSFEMESGDWMDITPSSVSSAPGDSHITANVTSFSQFSVSSNTSDFVEILPIELLEFNVRKLKDQEVELYWTTASELNNYGFDIERSADGRNWETIGFVAGAGNSLQIEYYNFKDKSPFKGINYYRLKQIDLDGRLEYHRVVSIAFGNDRLNMSVFPNPGKGNVTILLDKTLEEEGLILIYDLMGRLVSQQKTSPLSKEIQINMEQITQPGLYLIQFRTSAFQESVYFKRL